MSDVNISKCTDCNNNQGASWVIFQRQENGVVFSVLKEKCLFQSLGVKHDVYCSERMILVMLVMLIDVSIVVKTDLLRQESPPPLCYQIVRPYSIIMYNQQC